MTADFQLGDNYNVEEDSNGNLVITDSTGNTVLKHTDGGQWSIQRDVTHNNNKVRSVGLLETDTRESPQNEKVKWLSTQVTVADNDNSTLKAAFGLSESRNGHLWVSKPTDAGTAQAEIRGPFEQVVDLIYDSSGRYTNTAGNDGTINIYHDGSDYIVENKDGGERTLTLWYVTAP